MPVQFPELITTRLKLDALVAEDANALYRHFSDPEVVRFYDLDALDQIEQASALIELFQQRFQQSLGIRWAIRESDTQRLVGTAGFNAWNVAMHSAQLGYDVIKPCWGRGYATEALSAIIQTAFEGQLPCARINRIQADTVPGNSASEGVLKKLGFQEEGLLRQSGFWKGRYHDLKCFGLIKSDW